MIHLKNGDNNGSNTSSGTAASGAAGPNEGNLGPENEYGYDDPDA